MDLELDIIINPDNDWKIKDVDDYKKGIANGTILYEWIHEIETAKTKVLAKLAHKQYPFDSSWVNWRPDPNWSASKLPENWDKV